MTDTSITNLRHYNKLDLGKALKMRFFNGLQEAEIARYFKVDRSAISKALKPFKELFRLSQAAGYVKDNYVQVLQNVNANLLLQLANPKKIKEASLNNVSYAQTNIDRQIRLELGQYTENMSITAKDTSNHEDRKARIVEIEKLLLNESTVKENTDNRSDIPSPVNPMTTDTIEDAEAVVKK